MKYNKKTTNPQNDRNDDEGTNKSLNTDKGMQAITEMLGTYQGSSFESNFPDKVLDALKNEQEQVRQHTTALRLVSYTTLRMAAAIALLIVAGYYFLNQPRTYTAPLGTMSNVSFPDGSTVFLNSGSSVTFRPFTGKSTRSVQLHGEGFFDIVSSEKPFIVETFNTNIRVLGTRFGVTAWPNAITNRTSVTLEEGKISVHPTGSPEQVLEMSPKQTIVVYADATISDIEQLSENQTQNALSWRNGGYVFQDMPLGAITQELQRRGDLSITVPDELIDIPITYFEPNAISIQEVLDILSQAYAFSYSRTANGFALSPLANQQ